MASRHEIVTIDFRANAAKANPAMESLRSSAYDLRQEIEKTKTAIDEGIKTGKPQAELDKMGEKLANQERQLRSFNQAMTTLSKGVGTLSRAIDAFNTGTLDNMSAAFQKSAYNAAEVAKKALRPDSKTYQKDMAELDALQQKNLENLAKYKLRTEQLLNSIETGGKISSQDLKQEDDALRELMQILPHMGREWLEYNQLLTRVTDATKQQAEAEKRLTGAIVDANDARQRASQLTREGAEAAAHQHKEAEAEVAIRKQNIEALEKEAAAKQKEVSDTAALAIAKDKEVEKTKKSIAAIQDRIDNEEKDAKATEKKVKTLTEEADKLEQNAKTSRETAEGMKTDLKGVQDELQQVNEELAKMGTNTKAAPENPVTESVKQGAHEASLELAELERRLKKLAETKAEKQKIIDDFESKYGKTEDERAAARNKIIKDAQQKDFAAQEEAIKKIEQKWNTYWEKQEESAKEFAASIGKTLEQLGLNDITKHLEGPMADKAKSAYRAVAYKDYDLGEALAREGELTKFKHAAKGEGGSDAPEAKVIESLQRKYNEYINSLREAKKIETEYAPVHKALEEENTAYFTALGELTGLQEVENDLLQKKAALTNGDAQATEKAATATEKQTAAKKEEAKVEEQVVETKKKEKVTVESLYKKNQEVKKQIAELEEEKKRLIEQQEKSAKATQAETNAFKDLTQEQAKARLEQKQAQSTFKNENGRWQVTNREEAQQYLFDTLSEINPKNLGQAKLSLEGDASLVTTLLGKFKERYGMQTDDDAMSAIKELMSGGLVKSGFMNKMFLTLEQDTPKINAFNKEIADLTKVMNGETQAVDENAAVKQRLAEIDDEIAKKEKESLELSKQTTRLRNGITEEIKDEADSTEELNASRKKNIELLKQTIVEYQKLSAEKAKAEKGAMTKLSSVRYESGKLEVSNEEEVQNWIINTARNITGKKGLKGGSLALKGKDVTTLLDKFAERYKFKDEKGGYQRDLARDAFTQIVQTKGGLFKGNGLANFSSNNEVVVLKQNLEAYDKRNAKLQALTAIADGAAQGVAKVTDATKADAAAIEIWGKEVESRHNSYQKLDDDLKKEQGNLKNLEDELEKLQEMKANPQKLKDSDKDEDITTESYDELISKKEQEIATLKERIANLKLDRNTAKRGWESSAATLADMMGIPEVEEQQAAAADNTARSQRGKAKATKESADATKDATKASQEATAQEAKQNAEDQKREGLLKRQQQLEAQKGELVDKIAKKEEDAAGMEQKAANKRDEATKAIEKQKGAHEENAKAMGIETDNLKRQTEEQDVLHGKLGEQRKDLAGIKQQIDENANAQQQAQQKAAQTEKLTIDAMTEAVKVLEEKNRAIEPESAEWQENTRLIQQYKAELDRLKQQPVIQMMTERLGNVKNLSKEALSETLKFWQAMEAGAERGSHKLQVAAGNVKMLMEEERQRRMEIQKPMRENLNNLNRLSTNDLAETKKYWEAVRDGAEAGSAAYKKAELAVKALNNEENRRKSNAQAQYIHDQMQDLNNLSVSGLAEVKKYWQAMYDGAKKGSDEMKDAEAALKRINALETERSTEALKASASRLNGNLGLMSAGDLRQAIDDAKKYQLTLGSTSKEAKELAERIVTAEEHIKRYGVEAEREARRQEEADKRAARAARDKQEADIQAAQEQRSMMMQRSMESQRTKLSAEALAETKKYWEAVARGAEEGSVAQRNALTIMQRITDEEQRRNKAANERKASILSDDLSTYSEAEIREAIEAGKQLVQTYKVGSDSANELSTKIVKAENHIRQYGVEAERAAQQQAKSIEEMQKQLLQGTDLSQQALKAQEQYWQQLIDDPKTAVTSLDGYRKELEKVQDLQKEVAANLVKTQGKEALEFFEKRPTLWVDGEEAAWGSKADRASATEVSEQMKALEAYRDSLPKKTEAEKIETINKILEEQTRLIKEASGEWMSYDDAVDLAGKAGKEGFIATTQQVQKAVQAMERQRDSLIKTIQLKQKDGKATDEEEAKLQKLEKQLKDLKFEQDHFNMSHKKMQELLSEPAKAENLDELRAAIKRADGELRRMKNSLGDGSKEYQTFAAKVKEAKNELKVMEGQAKATSSAWDKAWSRLKTYVGMYMGFNMAWQRITGAADDMLELSDKMGEVRKTTGFTADEVGRLSDNLKKLDTRTDMTGLMEFSSLAGSIGMKTQEQVQGFTEAANMLAVSLPEMGNEASRTLMKIADATGDLEKNGGNVRETLERVGSTIIALRANSAAAAGPITDFVSRVGAVGAQAGISIDQIAALGATVDALGGRVEMSATALSRMIPAIKNNTFEVARAIGMTEKELKGMTGMEQMVAIFRKLHDSVKQFDMNTEDGMNGAADAVENMLGRSVSMQDVMKQLNQQGARAGIVFGLLSQNVDKLEEQLGTAREAYANNVALMNEYNKMNDTAAGKWARLKNQLEEFFVNADAQSWISDVIDWLRKLIDLITEEGPIGRFFRWSLVYLALWKAKWAEAIGTALISLGQYIFATKQSTAATAADTAAKTADAAATEATAVANEHAAVASGKFNKTMKANVIAAVATAVVALGWALYEYAQKAKKAAQQMDVMADVEKKAREESVKERAELEKLYKVTQDQTASMEERKKALKDMVGDAKYQEYYSKLSTESELAAAAANAYKDLSEQILATARARALDAKAEELQSRRIELEDQMKDREDWENENRGKYRAGKQEYTRQQAYVGSVTGGATAGFQESQIAQRGSAAMKPAIIDEFEGSVRERNRINGEIEQIDKDLDKLKQQVSKLNLKTDTGDGGNGGGGGGGDNNPYGNYDRVKSDYNDWDANALVNRRKEMLERVRALANGADVQAVLSEDAKFISEAVRKNIKTTSDAIEWYNTERLKIQEALHGKHLTNTGDWMDPKQQKIRKKLMQDDMKAYLEELDAYYTERKTEIDQARNDEEISEAEAWNRNIKNEAEWHKRRAELQIMYSNKHKQIAEDEQQAIAEIIAERTGDDAKYIKATIANTRKFSEAVKVMNSQGAKEYRKFQGDLDLGSEKDYNKVEKALGKHLKAIEDIINKERPFSGIVDSLQDNLGKMGILTADLGDDAKSAADELVRLTFLMGEAEKAYTMTVDQLLDDMRKHGFKEWADVISKDPSMQQGLLAMLRQTFDSVQDAIKKESGIIKKHVENMLLDVTEAAQSEDTRLQILQNSVQRANSLIGAGAASERVADKLAIKQIQLQINLQETRIRMLQKRGADAVALLKQEAELQEKSGNLEKAKQMRMDAENIDKSVGLTLTKEQVELDKQRVALSEKLEESQNRLYTSLREWATLLSGSVQSLMEATHAGDAEYYNELAKLNLTGKGGPGAGTYIVIDNEGTEDAKAHYEYLDERAALERQREIERQNAEADAWRKVMDDINNKLNEQITDWINANMQNASIDANTDATLKNTEALMEATAAMRGSSSSSGMEDISGTLQGNADSGTSGTSGASSMLPLTPEEAQEFANNLGDNPMLFWAEQGDIAAKQMMEQNKKVQQSTQSMFAKMSFAANMYGLAYQTMSNDNLSAEQKFEMFALQAAGQAAIGMLTANLVQTEGQTAVELPGILGKAASQLGPIAGPIAFAAMMALLGGLMGMAVSKVTKSKSQIAQVTGASVGAGRLSTGMLTYAEGNVNEFTDPASLTPGRSYNVDGADGKTYRAKYTGKNPSTHITNGPEFHLAGEKGREMIIDAGTTRQITMNENEIWQAIKTLSGGGRVQSRRSMRRGVRAFAEGNVDEFETVDSGQSTVDSLGFDPVAMKDSLDKNNELLERALTNGIKGVFNVYGKDGLIDSYDTGKKNVSRHGERY